MSLVSILVIAPDELGADMAIQKAADAAGVPGSVFDTTYRIVSDGVGFTVSAANSMARASTGEWILFMDAGADPQKDFLAYALAAAKNGRLSVLGLNNTVDYRNDSFLMKRDYFEVDCDGELFCSDYGDSMYTEEVKFRAERAMAYAWAPGACVLSAPKPQRQDDKEIFLARNGRITGIITDDGGDLLEEVESLRGIASSIVILTPSTGDGTRTRIEGVETILFRDTGDDKAVKEVALAFARTPWVLIHKRGKKHDIGAICSTITGWDLATYPDLHRTYSKAAF